MLFYDYTYDLSSDNMILLILIELGNTFYCSIITFSSTYSITNRWSIIPEVNTISFAEAPMTDATCSRAFSTALAADQPYKCVLE